MINLITRLCCAILLASCAQAALAGPDEVREELDRQRLHGFVAPGLAIERLQKAGADLERAPVALRMHYHNTLATLYVAADDVAQAGAQIAILRRMAQQEHCVPCHHYATVREIQQAVRQQDGVRARSLVAKLGNVTTRDKTLAQAIHYARAGALDSNGEHTRALEEGMLAARLAIDIDSPADQVRSLNTLMLVNIARNETERAGKLAREAYALADRIGFVYMLAYVRGNEAYLYAIKGDRVNQLRALNDVLAITRRHAGMADTELIALVNLAEYYLTARDFKRAAEVARETIARAEQANKPGARAVGMSTLGNATLELGDADAGLALLEKSLAVLLKADIQRYVPDAYSALGQAYAKAGRHQQAYAALQNYIELTEEARAKASEKAIAEAQEKFSAERKDHEIERLSLENGVRKAELDARAWQQRLWATAALALGLGAILLIQMVTRARRRNRLLEDSNAVLSDQSSHDPLTGAFNRRHCAGFMAAQRQPATKSRDRTYQDSVGMMLLDVDHFKHINDTYGHAAGDAVLVEMARRLQTLVRQQDAVVRWGGEEFVLLLPGTSADGLLVLAERVLRTIADQDVIVDQLVIPVTVSIGCVCYPLLPDQHWEDGMKVADAAMYMAKHGGRNRAVAVMRVKTGSATTASLADLDQAAASGEVTLQTVAGPQHC